MSKFAVALLFGALLAVTVQATSYAAYQGYPECYEKCYDYGTSELSCTAETSLHLVVRGRGRCHGSANSYCAAYTARSKDCIDITRIYSDEYCRPVDVYEDAKCWAFAAAKAITSASATVLCDGYHAYGCGYAASKGTALACSVVKTIIDINANLDYNKPECDVKIAALISAIAHATAESQATACSRYGRPAIDSDHDLAYAFEEVAADAFASCWAYCDGYNNVKSGVQAGGGADVLDSYHYSHGDGSYSNAGYYNGRR